MIRETEKASPWKQSDRQTGIVFYYWPKLFFNPGAETIRISLAFQREVINRIIPEVQPDLIHCYDWMTGLIPAMARRSRLPCLFSFYRLDAPQLLLTAAEEEGIDAAFFWQDCFFSRMPRSYEETRTSNPVNLLATGIFAASLVAALSPTYLSAISGGKAPMLAPALRKELQSKIDAGRLAALLPAPDPSFNPAADRTLLRSFGPETHAAGKLFNKLQLQESMGLAMDSTVPVCFWPTRLDTCRPGYRLMCDALDDILERYRDAKLQIVFVADGDGQAAIREKIVRGAATERVAVCDFDARRYRLAYAGSDFVLMPLYLDPCALPCRIGQRYGALPIAFDAGAIHDCTTHLDVAVSRGNGFLFKYFDATGLQWAMDQALAFYHRPRDVRARETRRVMQESLIAYDTEADVRRLIDFYRRAIDGAPVRFAGNGDDAESRIAA